MTLKNNLLAAFLSAATMTILFACEHSNPDKNLKQTETVKHNEQILSIDTFSVFPPEIDGCSCYFSNDSTEFKKGVYIYLNDYAKTSFLQINGVLTKFIQTDYKKVDSKTVVAKAKSDNYKITIEVKDEGHSGYESSFKSGTIKLTGKNNKTITKTFYGECGC